MSQARIGDKYVVIEGCGNGVNTGDVAEVIKEVDKRFEYGPKNWGFLWNPYMDESWGFSGYYVSKEIYGWRLLTNEK